MKTTLKTSSSMWKSYALISGVFVFFIVICGYWGFSLLNTQYMREMNLRGNIAGAILSEYPEAEQTLLNAMQDTDIHYDRLDKGFSILKKYGYRENPLMTDIPSYHSALVSLFSFLAVVLALYLIFTALSFYSFYRTRQNQESRLHETLEHFLADNYSILADKAAFKPVFGESFTDTLFKLGHKLMAKTQTLAEERDNTKTLVTDISHQLKTPVSALKSCLTMCMEADSEAERADFLERCASQMEHLENLVTVLVNISRLETSLITLKQEKILLSAILTDAVNTVYEKAMQKNIAIEVYESNKDDDISLFIDRHWTCEAIANILDNAIKYSPSGSMVSICIHTFYSYIQLEIIDQGIGIPKTEYNQIFKRFYRSNHPVVKQSEGSGVGLYLARRIIEEQGGTVTVRSAGEQGSVFDVRLPVE